MSRDLLAFRNLILRRIRKVMVGDRFEVNR
jgi:hypothetical protein